MSRSSLVPVAVAALVLFLPQSAWAAGRCPFSGQAQMTIWVQMQPNVQTQQQQVARQQNHMTRANAMPGRRCNASATRQTAGVNPGRLTPARRSTATRTETTIHRVQSTQTTRRSSVERVNWMARRPDGPGRPGQDPMRCGSAMRRTNSVQRNTRTDLHPTTVVRRASEEQKGGFRPASDWKRQSDTCRRIDTPPRRQAPAQRVTQTAQRKTVQSVHPATVWVRITVNVRCGSCHHCKGDPTQQRGRPGDPFQIARKPRMPFQEGKKPDRDLQVARKPQIPFQVGKKPERDVPIGRPGMPFQQGGKQDPLARLVRRPNPEQPFMVRPEKPALQPTVRVEKPALDRPIQPLQPPPALPPLASVIRPSSGRPLPGWMIPGQVEDSPRPATPATTEQPATDPTASLLPSTTQPIPTLDPPSLPALEGAVQADPLVGAKQSSSSVGEDSRRELLPSEVAEAPSPAPVAEKRTASRRMPPILERDDQDPFDPSARPSPLDLVLQPPALPAVVTR